jgi:hypothetical protein
MCLTVVVFVAVACQPIQPPAPPVPPDADASPPDPFIDARPDECALSLKHLAAIGCEPRKPVTGTWLEVCRHDRQNGVFELSCMNRASTVDAAQKCGVVCSPR